MQKNKYLERINFEKLHPPIDMPNLLEVQLDSYRKFLQLEKLPESRENIGIEAILNNVFPISDFKETAVLNYDSYQIGIWECKCGHLTGVEKSKPFCIKCGSILDEEVRVKNFSICSQCGAKNTIKFNICDRCGDRVKLKIERTPEECLDKGFDYTIPLRVKLRLAIYDVKDDKTKVIKDVKEQEIYFGEMPLITDWGSFIINGTERVVVSQLQRSPGVYFLPGKERGLYTVKVIPARGAWIEIEEKKNLLQIRLDKRTKRINITTFFKALGLYEDFDIIKSFYEVFKVKNEEGRFYIQTSEFLKGAVVTDDVYDNNGKKLLDSGTRLLLKNILQLKKLKVDYLPVDLNSLVDPYSAVTVKNVVDINEKLSPIKIKKLKMTETEFFLFFPENEYSEYGPLIANTLRKDKKKKDVEITEKVIIQSEEESDQRYLKNQGDAYIEIFKKLRPGEPVTLEGSKKFFSNMMKNEKRYDLSSVGRLKLNIKLGRKQDFQKNIHLLTLEDVVDIVKYYLRLKYDRTGKMKTDDIDHLANRRIRAVGELVEHAFRIGIARLERIIKERIINASDISTMLPRELINTKPVYAALKEFFGTSQLSQFMDQTNALSETTHKRRISSLGPGGVNRERAGFDVRDVHSTHYGRICPIETPEGPNIGLITSLTTYSRVNEYGFIETPFRKVKNGRIINCYKIKYSGDSGFKLNQVLEEKDLEAEIEKLRKQKKELPVFEYHPFYLTAWEEEGYVIAQANAPIDEKGKFVNKRIISRKDNDTILARPGEIDYMDISPKQIVSVSASLIPFFEHDDANRALMGSNMQRQAVPLANPKTPIVGTGMEYQLVYDSGVVIKCKRAGTVKYVDASRIIIQVDHDKDRDDFSEISADLYELKKYRRSNQNTMVNQRPLVKLGERVEAGQILCDGPATDQGELALGSNVLTAFLPWRGYNYEDAIVLSERLVKDSVFDSIYIVEESVEVRETKLGKEEVTRDIPGVSENALKNLDESGIVRIGAKVEPGDILIGKVTPKGESQLTPEEKLLKAIFGEQAAEIKDTSLYCPPGVEGTVIDVKIFNRRGIKLDERSEEIYRREIEDLQRNLKDETIILVHDKFEKIRRYLSNVTVKKNFTVGEWSFKKKEKIKIPPSGQLNEEMLKVIKKNVSREDLSEIENIEKKSGMQIAAIDDEMQEKIDQLKKGEEFEPGIIKIGKVLIAQNRKISVGDKMAGRHGNKGCVSKILPVEDMPFLEDGTPVDVVLNPLGVPSRMNVGQLFELILGWAGLKLGEHYETPVFDSAKEGEIYQLMEKAGLPPDGKVVLYDGITGERFSSKVTVGCLYMMKLEHMVEDKIHARSTGPYSLITQQPLGGKAQFGGQRVGEMEVWAFEAYGAAYILQELLTIKSDDVKGRNKIYSAIVKGNMEFNPGIPESFNVLLKELKSLALNVKLEKKDRHDAEALKFKENISNIS